MPSTLKLDSSELKRSVPASESFLSAGNPEMTPLRAEKVPSPKTKRNLPDVPDVYMVRSALPVIFAGAASSGRVIWSRSMLTAAMLQVQDPWSNR